ncbi:MAG: hypothetical protein ACFE8P_12245 [Promethearchaeota archaeon]
MAEEINIVDSNELEIIKNALEKILYVPDRRLKPKIIEELLIYLNSRLSDDCYQIRIFIAFKQEKICGFVISQVDPDYRSRNRKCGTFGWLNADDFLTCKGLMNACENFIRQNNIRLLRGNINFPKCLGGIGIQTVGFKEQILYGVAFTNPKSKILDYLEKLGYKIDTEYLCMEVTAKEWKKGKNLDKSVKISYLSLKEMKKRKKEILDLAKNAFSAVMPDSTTGESRFNEIIEIYSQVPKLFYKLEKNFNAENHSNIPEFLDVWKNSDLENSITWAPFAIHRDTNEILGVIFSLPDLYQLWLNEPITRDNVDTAMVKSGYTGKGIFSSLNNIGQLTLGFNGVNYFEGTTIWSLNQDALCSIMPHCKTNRKFVVFQKRIKKN